jgi:hypothetical protein
LSSALRFDFACPLVMVPLGFFNRCLGFRDRLLPSLSILSERGFFLAAVDFALPLLSLERECGLAGGLIVDLAAGRQRRLRWIGENVHGLATSSLHFRKSAL